jgi:hypothetical protein
MEILEGDHRAGNPTIRPALGLSGPTSRQLGHAINSGRIGQFRRYSFVAEARKESPSHILAHPIAPFD